jgi:all-beta uncharacterized protein/BACON domain-containing protein
VFASGTYVYGDFCSGEIFVWNDEQRLLFDTAMNISSFGEDEQGELYVVDLNGSISRLVSDCALTIPATSHSFTAMGGSDNVGVTAPAGCVWTAASTAPWIHVTSEPRGTGDGVVQYSVDPNTTASARTGLLAIEGQTITVGQSGDVPCTYAISPATALLPQPGGSGTITVTAPAECTWTAVSDSPWLVITVGASGRGSGRVIYAAPPYIGRAQGRAGAITIATSTAIVTQSR